MVSTAAAVAAACLLSEACSFGNGERVVSRGVPVGVPRVCRRRGRPMLIRSDNGATFNFQGSVNSPYKNYKVAI